MKTSILIVACASVLAPAIHAEETAPPEAATAHVEAPAKPTLIYRQVLPDGRVVYGDKAVSGAKTDQTITVDPAIKGNTWTTEPSDRRPVVTPRSESTPVRHVATLPPVGRPYVSEAQRQAAALEVMRAEMLLEDARKRQAAGIAARPSEMREDGQRNDQAYSSRQKLLARDVTYAEQELKKAQAARDALR
ncbi:MAG: hypothetical protein JSS58_05850 [Proteobacteria bacterium]|nr:hypothetical protein [Pseudomonadota bacterium]